MFALIKWASNFDVLFFCLISSQVLGIVMGAFVISWLPFFLVYTFDPFFKFELSEFTIMIFTWLGYINSSIVSISFLGVPFEHFL